MIKEKVLLGLRFMANCVTDEDAEILDMAISSIEKLNQIEKLIDDCDTGDISCEQLFMISKGVLENE